MVKNRLLKSLEMGCYCGVAGLIIGACFTGFSTGGGIFSYLWLRASLSATISGSVIWYFFVIKPEKYEDRGMTAGIAISLVSQYLCWYMLLAYSYLHYLVTGSPTNSFGEPPPNLFESVYVSALGLFLSLLWLFWLTLPVGAIIGAKVAIRQNTGPTSRFDTDRG